MTNGFSSYSLGDIQDPGSSIIAVTNDAVSLYDRQHGISSNEGQFSIADDSSQYLGRRSFY